MWSHIEAFKTLYKTVVRSHLEYSVPVWNDLYKIINNKDTEIEKEKQKSSKYKFESNHKE